MSPHLLLVLLVILAGCTDARDERLPAERTERDTSLDGEVEPQGALEVHRDLWIDGMEHDLVYGNSLAVSDEGVMALSQQQLNQVRLFDPSGHPLRSLGGSGDGPGEFRSVSELGWFGDTLWVHDLFQQRVTYFDADGEVMGAAQVPAFAYLPEDEDGRRYSTVLMRMFRDGSFLAALTIPQAGEDDPLLPDGGAAIARTGSDGRIEAILTTVRPVDGEAVGTAFARPPFPNDELWEASPTGQRIATAYAHLSGPRAGMMRVTQVALAGDTIFDRWIPFQETSVPDSVADHILERYRSMARTAPTRNVAEARSRAARVPQFYPPAAELTVGHDGRMWIRGYLEERGYRIIDAQGRASGWVLIPTRARVLAADSSTVWTAEFDEMGVMSLARYRIGGSL